MLRGAFKDSVSKGKKAHVDKSLGARFRCLTDAARCSKKHTKVRWNPDLLAFECRMVSFQHLIALLGMLAEYFPDVNIHLHDYDLFEFERIYC